MVVKKNVFLTLQNVWTKYNEQNIYKPNQNVKQDL